MAPAGEGGQSRDHFILQAIELQGRLVVDPRQLRDLAGGGVFAKRGIDLFGVGREVRFVGVEVACLQVGQLGERGGAGSLEGRGCGCGAQAATSRLLIASPAAGLMLAVACFHAAPILEM